VLLIKQAISSDAYDLAPSSILISEIQELARLNFMTFSVNVIPRNCNRVARKGVRFEKMTLL
jgi:hypothetical protein